MQGAVLITPPLPVPVQVLKSVQKGRVNSTVVYLVGIELDKPRESGATKDGFFLGHQVVECEPGRGFVCEEVRVGPGVCVSVVLCDVVAPRPPAGSTGGADRREAKPER